MRCNKTYYPLVWMFNKFIEGKEKIFSHFLLSPPFGVTIIGSLEWQGRDNAIPRPLLKLLFNILYLNLAILLFVTPSLTTLPNIA